MSSRAASHNRFQVWLAGTPDDQILRWLFRTVLVVTAGVLAIDLATMNGWLPQTNPALRKETTSSPTPDAMPSLPAILAPLLRDGDRRTTPMPQPDGAMAKPMTFELVSGGKLMATGSITPGIAESFAREVKQRGDYIKTIVLNSPGGSVTDALAMGRLIRDKKFATEVEAGKYCASSCPLMFAGGVERRAGDKAAIGVHQIFAMGEGAPGDGMSDAQRISARCQRYLGDMGINLQVWVHAMETPKDKLFVFKPDELKSLNLVTADAGVTGASASGQPLPPAPAPTPPQPAPRPR